MRHNYNLFKGIILGLCVIFTFSSAAIADDIQTVNDEKQGIEITSKDLPKSAAVVKPMAAPTGPFLLIPDSTTDTVGMFDPHDGTYLGNLIDGSGMFSTPINAILGPNQEIYVSDQVADSVFVFDIDGNYLSTYADGSDGLNNIRGIDFYKGHLFVTSGDDYVAEFDGPHSRLPDFIGTGMDPFDIFFLPDGSSVVTDISADMVKYYKPGGIFDHDVIAIDFGEQVRDDTLLPGAFLCAAFSDKQIFDFELNGTLHEATPLGTYGRGVYRLGNGNLLSSDGTGVYELDPGTGNVIDTKYTGSCRFIELIDMESLTIDNTKISEASGGKATLTLEAGLANAGRTYLFLGTVSGTSPGIVLPKGMATLPINWDIFTGIVVSWLNNAPFQSFYGVLDANGKASAIFDTLGPIPGTAGLTISFAACLNKPYDFASNAVGILITP